MRYKSRQMMIAFVGDLLSKSIVVERALRDRKPKNKA